MNEPLPGYGANDAVTGDEPDGDADDIADLHNGSGPSIALQAGVDRTRAHYVVTLDADLRNDPADIPAMVRTREPIDGYRRTESRVRKPMHGDASR